MKKFFKNVAWFSKFALMSSCLFVAASCSDDDENGGTGGGAIGGTSDMPASPVITTESGQKLLLTSVGDVQYTYDNAGFCTGIDGYDDDENWVIRYKPFKITVDYGPDTQIDECTGTFNSKGFLKSLSVTINGDEENLKDNLLFAYDAENHLIKSTTSYFFQWKEEYDGEVYVGSEKGEGTTSFIWTDGNLTKGICAWSCIYSEDGEKFYETEKEDYTITYGETPNKYLQYPNALDFLLDYGLGMTGMMGAGPRMLPSKVEYKGESDYGDGDVEKWEESHRYEYTLNEDGTIASETSYYGNGTYDYTYTPLSDYVAAPAASVKKLDAQVEAAKSLVRSHIKRIKERRLKR